jgi:hypothetical protein
MFCFWFVSIVVDVQPCVQPTTVRSPSRCGSDYIQGSCSASMIENAQLDQVLLAHAKRLIVAIDYRAIVDTHASTLGHLAPHRLYSAGLKWGIV